MAHTLLLALLFLGADGGASPPSAISVRLVRPERQGERILNLFQGTRAPHPAAALAGWKRATGRSLEKWLEALIALGNPATVHELKTFDGAEASFACDPTDGRIRWHAVVPHDDGTLAALVTALALTDGAREVPLGSVAVDRLGRPGSPVTAQVQQRFVVAGSRADLRVGLDRLDDPVVQRNTPIDSEILITLDPNGLGSVGPLPRRRLAETLRGLGCVRVEGSLGLRDETLALELTGRYASPFVSTAVLEPSWVEWAPAASTVAAFSIAIDPKPEAWASLFALADRIERADPARAGVAPLRTRLDLMALAAKVRLEDDLWSQLRGLTVVVLRERDSEANGVVVALHTADPDAARRLEEHVLPKLTARWLKHREPEAAADALKPLGHLHEQPVLSSRRGSTLLIGWGAHALRNCLRASEHPERSAGAAIRADWGQTPPQRVGALWPGRLESLVPAGTALAQALTKSPPILWSGRNMNTQSHDVVRWPDLRGLVRRLLERLPMAEAGDRP